MFKKLFRKNSLNINYEHNGHNASVTGPLIALERVTKHYHTPAGSFLALDQVDLTVHRGDFLAIVGKSGSGKSTLINMVTGIDKPTGGQIWVNDIPIHSLSEGVLAQWRGRTIGIVFQFFQLLPTLSCLENVVLPMDFCQILSRHERIERAIYLLEQVGMAEHRHKLPSEVSGGQQQRVAIARALANDPPILVTDEPTGNLDSNTANVVFMLFEQLVAMGKTVIMVTHDNDLAKRAAYNVTLADGTIVDQQMRPLLKDRKKQHA